MQQSKQQVATRVLFWSAFGIFLMVSIPHVAWVFRQYEPQDQGITGFVWWVLAYGFAIAIDGVIGWLSHIKSEGTTKSDQSFIWGFIVVLVMMSWYFNWVFSMAHDPSQKKPDVWTFVLTSQMWFVPSLTVGQLTPVVISALPVFIIAYTFILGKVNAMKVAEAKSLADLQAEANEAEERAKAEKRIRAAQNEQKDKRDPLGNVFTLAKRVRTEAQGFVGEKRDPEVEKLDKVLQLFRSTPELLSDENAELAETAIMEVLHVKRPAVARFWRIKAGQVLAQESANTHDEISDDARQSDDGTNDNSQDESVIENGKSFDDALDELGKLSDSSSMNIRRLFDERSDEATDNLRIVDVQNTDEEVIDKSTVQRPIRPRYVAIDDAALLTGYAVETLKRKVSDGEIKRHPNDKNRVLVSSLRALKRAKRSESSTSTEPVLEALSK